MGGNPEDETDKDPASAKNKASASREDPGDIETKVRGDIEALVTSHPMGESLAEMAYKLARTLDFGDVKDLAVAGINKELRETLCELARLAAGDDDDLAAALSVPTSLRHGEES